MTLKALILSVISAVLLVSLAVGGALSYVQAQRRVAIEMQAAIDAGTRAVERAISETALSASDASSRIANLPRAFDGSRHLVVALVDDRGEVTTRSALADPENRVPDWFYGLLAIPPARSEIDLPTTLRPDSVTSVRLTTDSRSEIDEIWGEAIIDLSTLGLFCVSVLAVLTWTLGRVLAPLSDLSKAFGRIGDGDYQARLREAGTSELVQLIGGFNSMAGRLGAMQDANVRLNDQLTRVQDEERADLARDLHDEVSPLLFSVDVDAQAIRQFATAGDTTAAASRAADIVSAVGMIKRHVRSILNKLRPATVADVGLADAIEGLVAFWRSRRPDVSFTVRLGETGWSPAIEQVVHAVVREALSNALKHAQPSEVAVRIWEDGASARVEIIDDGGGMAASKGGQGFGLVSMRERVAAEGGRFHAGASPDGRGVMVTAELPLAAEPDTTLSTWQRPVSA